MTDADTIARRYIETWNAAEADRRALIGALCRDDVTFVDPVLTGDGPSGLDTVIGQVRGRFPGHSFALIGKPDGFGDYVRLSWALSPDGGEAAVKGTDFIALKDGQVKSVTGFFDQVPG